MFKRIFGGTEEEQIQFLQVRSIITLISLPVAVVSSFFIPYASALIALVMLFIWGWGVVKKWFGLTTLGAIFSRNIVIGVVLFVLYIAAAYMAGVFFAVLGIGRWIYLKIKLSKTTNE